METGPLAPGMSPPGRGGLPAGWQSETRRVCREAGGVELCAPSLRFSKPQREGKSKTGLVLGGKESSSPSPSPHLWTFMEPRQDHLREKVALCWEWGEGSVPPEGSPLPSPSL